MNQQLSNSLSWAAGHVQTINKSATLYLVQQVMSKWSIFQRLSIPIIAGHVQALILSTALYLMQQVMSEVSINNFLLLTPCQEETICIYQQFSTYGSRSRTEYQSFKKQEQTVYQSATFYLWQHSLYQQLFTRCNRSEAYNRLVN